MARKNRKSRFESPFLRRLSLDPEKMGEGWPFEMPLLQDGAFERLIV